MPVLTVGSLPFSGDTSGREGFHYNKLTGWFDLTDSKSDVNERPQAHGAFGISQDWRTSAAISFHGWFSASTRAEVIAAKNALNGALGDGKPKIMTLTDVDGTTSRVVSVRYVKPNDNRATLAFEFDVDVIAPDPLRYGPEVPVVADVPVATGGLIMPLGAGAAIIDFGTGGASGRVAVTNPGTAPTSPAIEVTGGLELGFVITDTTSNRVIRFERQIPLGSTVYINQRTGRAYLDNAASDVSGFLTSRGLFEIGPGETHQIQFQPLGAVTGAPQMTLLTAAAYL